MTRLNQSPLVLLCCILGLAFSQFVTSAHSDAAPNSSSSTTPPSFDIADAGHPSIRVFTDSDGLPVNSIMTLALDQKQYIWAGTQDGVAYYNGRQWTSLRMPKQGASNFVHDILAARDGSVWFATDGSGVFRWKDGEWLESYDATKGLPTNATRALLETVSPDGVSTIWVGTREGLARLEQGKWEIFKKASGLPDDRVRCLMATVSESGVPVVWVGTYGGLGRLESGRWQTIDTNTGLPSNIVYCVLETTAENGVSVLWAGTEMGLARLENGRWTTFDKNSGLPVNVVRSLRETHSPAGTRTLWVGTDSGGLARLENGKWTVFDTKGWLPNDLVWDLLETEALDGALWIATLGGGLVRLEGSNWTSLDTKNGLPNRIVFSFLETAVGNDQNAFWIGTYGGGLVRFEAGKQIVINAKSGLPSDYVQCLLETVSATGERVIWVGTEGGLGRFEKGKWTAFRKKDGLPVDEVWDLLETTSDDGTQTLWIATSHGLARLENGHLSAFDEHSGLPDKRLRSLHETRSKDGKRTLWVGTYTRGLAKFEDGKWTTIDTSSGLPNNRVLDIFETRADSAKHQLWVGTGGGGVAVLDLDLPNAEWETISNARYPAMLNDYVYQIRQDASGRVYLTTNKGVVRLTPRPVSNSKEFPYSIYTFTTEDGLPSNECNAGASLVDCRGRIWVGTVNGAAVFDPLRDREDHQPKPLYVEKVLVRGQARTLTHGSSLPYDQNSLKFEFALLSHFRESATRYRTQLIGLEEKPTEWVPTPSREFNYLPAGDYVFKVWGRDHAGNISGPFELSLNVRPAPWRTWWAYSLYVLVIALLGAGAAYVLNQHRLERLLAVESVRMRIATDLHDDIGASLSQIAVLSEVAVQTMGGVSSTATRPLTRISDTSRELVRSMSDVVWSINPQRDLLGDLIQRMRYFATEVFTARDIDFEFRAEQTDHDLKLDVDLRRQVLLIYKESVNNIVRHSRCTKVEIDFGSREGGLVLQLKDDGEGFDTARQNTGNGLSSMRSRAASIKGTIEIDSKIGMGTRVTLRVPTIRHSFFRRFKSPHV